MSDLLFVVKMFVITVLLVVVMQIKWGENTLEQKASIWIKQGVVAMSLRDAAQGGIEKAQDEYDGFIHKVKFFIWKTFIREEDKESSSEDVAER